VSISLVIAMILVSVVGLFLAYLGHEAWVSADQPSDGSK
jgi:hypothetical protein